jgi:hypothetical protein
MKKLIEISHEVHESTGYINGLFDIFKWNGSESLKQIADLEEKVYQLLL